MINDTIVALATPNMKSAISIIRVSGDNSIELVNEIFSNDLLAKASHTINYGYIVNQDQKIDEVLVSVFKAPNSYTRENVVEINTHGGIAITRKVLQLILAKGARLANPGEFSKRAYLNGRIDLLELEAINEMIEATSEKASELAMSGLSKETSKLIQNFKIELLDIIANIEVNIDYPEYDDVEELENVVVKEKLLTFKKHIEEIIKSSKTSRLIKNGIKVAIVGEPNAGKSSLLNTFLEQDKAIVTDIAGTTRDIVEAEYLLNGVNLIFLDTAGIRQTDDTIESMGIEKSYAAINEADLAILVIDSCKDQLSNIEQQLIEKYQDKLIVALNKSDLCDSKLNGVKISAKHNDISELKKLISDKLDLDIDISNEELFLSNQRHLALLESINHNISDALNAIEALMPNDIVVSDIEIAYNSLQELLGEQYHETLLDELFSKFCLGK